MVLPGLVETPLFPDAQCGVDGRLAVRILSPGVPGGYFHDQVGGLALAGDDVGVVAVVEVRTGVEGDEHVGEDALAGGGVRLGYDEHLSRDDSGFLVAGVLTRWCMLPVRPKCLALVMSSCFLSGMSVRGDRLLLRGHIRPLGLVDLVCGFYRDLPDGVSDAV